MTPMPYYEERRARVVAVEYTKDTQDDVIRALRDNKYTDVSITYDDQLKPWVTAKMDDGFSQVFTYGSWLVKSVAPSRISHQLPDEQFGDLRVLSARDFRYTYQQAGN